MHGFGQVDVDVENIFNTNHDLLNNQLHINIDRPQGYAVLHGVSTWLFKEHFLNTPVNENLVVVWRTKFIDSSYPEFKDSYDSSYWDLIIPILKMKGYTVLELTHRTPISEVFHAIASCKFIVAYNGMYHYISKNLIKPMVVLGDSSILRTHNPQAVHFFSPEKDERERDVLDFLLNIDCNLDKMIRKTERIKRNLYPIVYGKGYG